MAYPKHIARARLSSGVLEAFIGFVLLVFGAFIAIGTAGDPAGAGLGSIVVAVGMSLLAYAVFTRLFGKIEKRLMDIEVALTSSQYEAEVPVERPKEIDNYAG